MVKLETLLVINTPAMQMALFEAKEFCKTKGPGNSSCINDCGNCMSIGHLNWALSRLHTTGGRGKSLELAPF